MQPWGYPARPTRPSRPSTSRPWRASAGVVAVYTVDDIPGTNDCGPIIHDDPIFAPGLVQYVGQPIFIVVADTHDNARRAARLAQITYAELPAILTPQAARAAQSYVLPPMRLARGDSAAAFARAPHTVKGELHVGGQEQFYLEGQIAYAIPKEDQGMLVLTSTQHPSEMQHVVAHALGLHSHHIVVECRRMGGGFGGKESQSALWCAAAAIAAATLKKPVKLRADRDDDMLVTGKRHCFHYEYEVGYDDNGRHHRSEGRHGLPRRLLGRPCPAPSPRAPSATSTTRIICQTSKSAPRAARRTRSRIRRSAVSAARRVRSPSNTSSMKSPATWDATRSTSAA